MSSKMEAVKALGWSSIADAVFLEYKHGSYLNCVKKSYGGQDLYNRLVTELRDAYIAGTGVELGAVLEESIEQLVATGYFGVDREAVVVELIRHRLRELVCEGWIKVEGINLETVER